MKKIILTLLLGFIFLFSQLSSIAQNNQVKRIDDATQVKIQSNHQSKDKDLSLKNTPQASNSSKAVINSESFETSVPPAGWTEYQVTGSYSWQQSTARVNTGSYSAFFDDYSGDNDVWLISGSFDLDAYNSEILSYYENVNYGTWATEHNVKISTNYTGSGDPNLATWTTLNSTIGTEDIWVQKTFDISGYSGTAYIAFQYVGNYDSEWYIDDFQIEGTPAIPGTNTITAGSNTEPTIIESIIDTQAESFINFDFTVTDDGVTPATDTKNTLINTIVINQGTGNDISDWTEAIAGAELSDGTNSVSGTINSTNITFTLTNTLATDIGYISDNSNKTYSLKIWLKSSLGGSLPSTIDGLNFVFAVSSGSFGLESTSSGFNNGENENSGSNNNEVSVTATEISFTGQPSSTATSGVALVQQPIVEAIDANGNRDLDLNTTITLSNSGTLLMSNNSMSFTNGLADFAGSNFQFTTGGEYVTLSATDGNINSLTPSSEIAVDIIGCLIFDENFDAIGTRTDLNGAGGWYYTEITGSTNDWGIAARTGNGNCMTIYNNGTAFSYKTNDNGEEIAYYNTAIDATDYRNVTIEFDWQSRGESSYDYGTIMWSTDGINWSIANETVFQGQNTWTTGTYDLSVVDGQQFYIGFKWINNNSGGNTPPFAVDNIEIRGIPNFDYYFSYRDDNFESITGTIAITDANDGTNISLPSGFDFQYDGVPISNVRANINGWIEMGTTHTANSETNTLNNSGTIPFLAPLWDDLSADAQTRIIYLTEGDAPNRVFTIEWLDVLWGGTRQNFQVKLYETSYVIEFWYGQMHSPSSGSASIGINNAGSCMNKMISVTPGTTPSASFNTENSTIASATYLTEGLVYIFNPLVMQSYTSWEDATIVVGQTNFTNNSTSTSQTIATGANSSSVSSKGVLAVGSSYANRVLLWNSLPQTDGVQADVIIGQTNWTDITSGTSSTKLSTPTNVAYSPDGEKLLIVDGGNNRVLIYNTIPTINGVAADYVIGQADMTSDGSGITDHNLNYPTGALVLPDGRLLITDFGNNRVLIFNEIPDYNGASADIVIGQPNFTTNTEGDGANELNGPWDCAYSPEGKLIISDDGYDSYNSGYGNHRLLIYNDIPTTNGASADIVVGNTTFSGKNPGTTKDEFNQPSVTCSVEGKLAIADFGNSRVIIYNRLPAYNGVAADYVLGQPNFETKPEFNDGYNNTGSPDQRNMYYPYSICFDLNGRLYVNGTHPSGSGMNRVMIFGDTPTETSDLEVTIVPDLTTVCVYNKVEYAVEVINHGGDDAYNVVVNAQLPQGIIHINYDAQDGSTYNQKSGYWKIPFIAVGDTVRLAFSGEVQPELAGNASVVAYANTLASSQNDNDYSNNGDNATVAVREYFAPTISEIDDQYIPRNSSVLVNFTVDDGDGLSDITSYTATSSNTTLIPLNYTTNIIFSGVEPDKTVNLVPVADLYGKSEMSVIVTDSHGCFNEEPFMIIVGNYWEGDDLSTPTKWDVSENWSYSVPTPTIEAIIPTKPIGGFFPIIDIEGAECQDLFVEPRANVTINDTYGLHIFGKTYLKSDITGTASFTDLSTVTSEVINDDSIFVERYLTPDAWHYLASPLDAVSNTVLTQDNCGGYYNGNIIKYNEAFNSDYDGDGDIDWFDGWEWPWFYTHNTNIFVPGIGYGYYSYGQCDDISIFTGDALSFNTGEYSIAVTNQDDTYKPTGSNPHRGWNLIANPYPSGLNAEDFLITNLSVIDGTIYFWDEDGMTGFELEGADYASFNPTLGSTTGSGAGSVIPDKYVSIGQAFFVHRTVTDIAGSNVTFNNSMRETENSSYFKDAATIQKLKLSLNHKNLYNEIIVGLIDDATKGIDHAYDGYKIEGNKTFSFYSLINTERFVNQAIPTINSTQNESVALGFNAENIGEYTIELKYIQNIDNSINIILEDTYTGTRLNIRNESQYTFEIENPGRYEDRFILHFNSNTDPVAVEQIPDMDVNEDEEIMIYIPEYYFEDNDDGDILTYSLSLKHSDLPSWMKFDKKELLITGFPANENVGDYSLKMTATDIAGASVEQDFIMTVKNVNDAPVLTNEIPDAKLNSYETFNYVIPVNTFIDVDEGDQIRYEAYMDEDKPLPAWLSFDGRNGTFYGIPSNDDAKNYKIRVFAIDNSSASSYDDFKIKVSSVTDIPSVETNARIYPNPSNGIFTIENKHMNYKITITDASGRVIYSEKAKSTKENINISAVEPGEYLIKMIYDDNTFETQSLIIVK